MGLDMATRNNISKAMRMDRKQKKKERRSRYGRMNRLGSISESDVSDFESDLQHHSVELSVSLRSLDISPFSTPEPPSPEHDYQEEEEEQTKKRTSRKKKKKKKKKREKHFEPSIDLSDNEVLSEQFEY